ncbi:MAG TPA: hypothetical protein VEH54_01895 [Steroidobacteraceae bacterium]|nr:hypothetical protein [Steroidobacteraceae bacterium]
MSSADAVCALALVFVAGMVWLRTRLQYARGSRGALSLTRAGSAYFAALLLLLGVGWFASPALARHLTSSMPLSPTLTRIAWFLGAYYLFIPVHRVLRAQGLEVLRAPPEEPTAP